jgi:hypothetical protein
MDDSQLESRVSLSQQGKGCEASWNWHVENEVGYLEKLPQKFT